MSDCVSIGDCVFDVNLFLHEAVVHCRKDAQDCEICLKYGQKIPVDSIQRSLGGNACNNAVGLKRLGLAVALYTIFGDDQIGERIGQMLEKEGIGKSLVKVEPGESRYSTIINFKGERTILAYGVDRHYKLPATLPETRWIFLSAVGPHYQEFFQEVAALVKEKSIKLAFAPAEAQLHNSLTIYRGVLSASQIVFVNSEEAERLLGPNANGQIKKLLFGVRDLGPKIVVITDGVNGSYAYDGDKYYFIGLFDKFAAVEATGAGDAYASGFLAAIISGQTTAEAMRWGAINSASVVSKTGAQTGLLKKEELTRYLGEREEFKTVEI